MADNGVNLSPQMVSSFAAAASVAEAQNSQIVEETRKGGILCPVSLSLCEWKLSFSNQLVPLYVGGRDFMGQ